MNLHKIANAAVRNVHPNEVITLFKSLGQVNEKGIIKPKYLAPEIMEAQVQDDADSSLQHTDTVNQTGHVKRFYVNKYTEENMLAPQSLVRQKDRTGDIIMRSDETYWKVTQVLEDFDLHVVLKAELLTVPPDFSEQDWYEQGQYAGSIQPRSGSAVFFAQNTSDSECTTGRHPTGGKAVSVGEGRALQKWTAERCTERHGKEQV